MSDFSLQKIVRAAPAIFFHEIHSLSIRPNPPGSEILQKCLPKTIYNISPAKWAYLISFVTH